MTGFKITAVVFDLDGLVLDSETTYIAAWRRAAEELGCSLDDAFCRTLSGMHGTAVERSLRQHCGIGFDIERFRRLSTELWREQVRGSGIPVKHGFFKLIKVIQEFDLPFALATNSRRKDAEFCLEAAGLAGVFPVFVARDEVENGKPAPDVFVRAAALLATKPADCLVLEDSPIGVAGALAAGSPCIYVPSIYPADDHAAQSATAVLESLEKVADFLSAFLHRG